MRTVGASRRPAAATLALLMMLAGCGGGSAATHTAPTSAAHSVADALTFVKSIYAPYLHGTLSTPTLGNCFGRSGRPCVGAVDRYMTARLRRDLLRIANQGTGSDPIVCGQNTPGRVTYGRPASNGRTATIIVHTFYTGSGDVPITVTVDLKSMKLTGLRCP